MKIGLSYSVVNIDDVLVLITRTDFDPHNTEQWNQIWAGYRMRSGWSQPEWMNYSDEDESKFREISIELYDSGRMHQPRQFGAHPSRLPHIWLDTILPSEDLNNNPGVKAAWEKFQTLASLSSVNLNEDHRV
jgi:hypothetical protein